MKSHYATYLSSFIFLLLMVIFSSCSTTKYLEEDEVLVIKNKVNLASGKKRIDEKEVRGYLRQKANRRLFSFFRFKLLMYERASKRIAKGRDTKYNRWLKNTVGEPPVIYDSLLARESAHEIKLYLRNLGYFNARVTTQSEFSDEGDKVTVIYNLYPSKPYRITNIDYDIADPHLAKFVYSDTSASLVKPGMYYNAYTLDKERDRITEYLNNHGYYKFTEEYILYEIDSSLNNHAMDATLKIENVLVPSATEPGKFYKKNHNRYYIRRIFVNPDFDPVRSRNASFDTLKKVVHPLGNLEAPNYYYFLYDKPMSIKPNIIAQSIFIENREYFKIEDVRQTYRRFSGLSAFSYTNIQFKEVDTSDLFRGEKQLDCNVNISRSPRQSFSVDTEGTNRGGDLGIGVNLTYLNKNIFKGAEVLRINLRGAVEAQKVTGSLEEQEKQLFFFNTWEAGLDATIIFPKFLIPIKQERFPKYFRPKTTINTGFNLQQRPSYSRNIANVSFGYDWEESEQKQHIVIPAEINLVKVFPTPEFTRDLEAINDASLRNQYTDHLILSGSYSFIFNNQDIKKLKNFIYFRGNLEISGNLLNLIDRVVNAPKDTAGFYTLFNIRYSQYVRADVDFRYYFIFNRENSLVYRSLLGIGIPYSNADVLPFEKGFYLGGANGMRAWRFRSLGPGSFPGGDENFDKSGDIMIEQNLEYRFPIYRSFKGGLFVDVGNVWLLNENVSLPGGEFRFNDFLPELAVDYGLGFRLDFKFFIFRVDAALRARDPARPKSERWVIGEIGLSKIVWNFGIGYPF